MSGSFNRRQDSGKQGSGKQESGQENLGQQDSSPSDVSQSDVSQSDVSQSDVSQSERSSWESDRSSASANPNSVASDADWDEALQSLEIDRDRQKSLPLPDANDSAVATVPPATWVRTQAPPLAMVETAFLASTASLLWLVSYYLSIGPWMRILFPTPIALVYLRWGARAAWMSAIVSGLLLSVLMGPYLSILFFVPYGLLGVQLGMMWKRRSPWLPSMTIGTLISTFGFFFRMSLLSVFLGEDLWNYLTNRITDFVQWLLSRLVNVGLLSLDVLGETNVTVVQIFTVLLVLCSDFVYVFTVHLAAWLLLERVGNAIPDPPRWVQVLMEEE